MGYQLQSEFIAAATVQTSGKVFAKRVRSAWLSLMSGKPKQRSHKKPAREAKKHVDAKRPPLIRLKEFLQNFHDTDEYSPDRAFCFIIGSGAAATAKIPTGSSLVDRWLVEMHDMEDACEKRLLAPHAKIETFAGFLLPGETERLKAWSEKRFASLDGFTFAERARFYGRIYKERFQSEPALGQQFLRKLIHHQKPSIAYHLLARILNRTSHNVVITTNFDRLVEDSIAIMEKEAVQSFGHAELASFVQRRPKHPVVAKIHGDITLQTYNATDELEKLNEHWEAPLRALFQSYTPIVIGYGGNDPGFMRFLIDEMKTWDPERRCYWFVRKESRFDGIPFCAELADVPALRLVECPGFTELMLKLDEIFNLKPLHEELGEQAKIISDELREAESKARGELADHERQLKESILRSDGLAESKSLAKVKDALPKDNKKRTWNDWRGSLFDCPDPTARKKVLLEALKEFPGNLPLQAAAAAYDLRNRPADNSPLNSIQRWLRESEAATGSESNETLAVMHSLAYGLDATGELDQAESLYRRVSAARERVLGAEHPDTLNSRNNLAIVLSDQGKLAEAEAEHRAVLAIRERVLGAEQADTLSSRNSLANMLYEQGKFVEAEAEYRAVLAICERVLGAEHSDVLGICYNLALCLEGRKKLKEALAFMKRAEAGWKKVYGPEYPFYKQAELGSARIESKLKQNPDK